VEWDPVGLETHVVGGLVHLGVVPTIPIRRTRDVVVEETDNVVVVSVCGNVTGEKIHVV
jgi:hypothetical protein